MEVRMVIEDELTGKTEPFWCDEVSCWMVKWNEHWVVMILPMLYNDRVVIGFRDDRMFTRGYEAGWCYDKGPAAMLAAMAWEPDTKHTPVGFKKEAFPRNKDWI